MNRLINRPHHLRDLLAIRHIGIQFKLTHHVDKLEQNPAKF